MNLNGTLSSGSLSGEIEERQSLVGELSAQSLSGELSANEQLTGTLGVHGTLEGEIVNPSAVYVYDYNRLDNKPSINEVELINDKSFEELGVRTMTNLEILAVFNRVFGGD